MNEELYKHIVEIAWDDSADAGTKIACIQSLLYQEEQNQTAISIMIEEQYREMAESMED